MPGIQSIVFLSGLAVLGIALLLHIIGVATPEWVVGISNLNQRWNQGLWKICVESVCDTIPEYAVLGKLKVVRAFAIIAVLLGATAGALLSINVLFSLKGNPPHRLLAIGSLAASFAALVSIIISVAVWGSLVKLGGGITFGYSFALCIVGGILMTIGCSIAFAGYLKARNLN
jgi:hypothetical protein